MRSATYATALTLILGWLLWIGKPILALEGLYTGMYGAQKQSYG